MRGFTHESAGETSKEWYTPPEIFEGLGRFDVDVASPGAAVVPWVPADRHITRDMDGLKREHWKGRVWCNPPYGDGLEDWVKLCIDHGNAMLLVFNRSETRWSQLAVEHAWEFKRISGRVKFMRPDGTRGKAPGAGSEIFAFGVENAFCLDEMKVPGVVCKKVWR